VRGTPNKMGATAKENIIAVFTRLGGTAQMAEWAKDNLTDFYRLYARLIPQEVSGHLNVTHTVDTGDAQTLAQRLDAALDARAKPSLQ
jgi:hypothetical protein